MSATAPARRYAALLLFQFRVEADGRSSQRRTCERRLILLEARGAGEALRRARTRGREAEHSFPNEAGRTVHFEFVGVQDLLHLGPECAPDEVWYEVVEMVRPMERRDGLIPSPADLQAMSEERARGRP